MTKRDLQQVYALTRLPGWALLKAELNARALTKVRQQWDKSGEKLAQASGQAIEAAALCERLEEFESVKTEKDEGED